MGHRLQKERDDKTGRKGWAGLHLFWGPLCIHHRYLGTHHMHPTIFLLKEVPSSKAKNLAGLRRLTSSASLFYSLACFLPKCKVIYCRVHVGTIQISRVWFSLSFCISQPTLPSPRVSHDYVSANLYSLTRERELISSKKTTHKRE